MLLCSARIICSSEQNNLPDLEQVQQFLQDNRQTMIEELKLNIEREISSPDMKRDTNENTIMGLKEKLQEEGLIEREYDALLTNNRETFEEFLEKHQITDTELLLEYFAAKRTRESLYGEKLESLDIITHEAVIKKYGTPQMLTDEIKDNQELEKKAANNVISVTTLICTLYRLSEHLKSPQQQYIEERRPGQD